MKQKGTDDLQVELLREPNLDVYIKSNSGQFSSDSLACLLTQLFEGTKLSKAALARQAGMSEVYLHQLFSGRRKPSRDRLLCICICLNTSLETAQALLKHAAYAPLYPRIKRDAIILHGIAHRTPLYAINEYLFDANEKSLY